MVWGFKDMWAYIEYGAKYAFAAIGHAWAETKDAIIETLPWILGKFRTMYSALSYLPGPVGWVADVALDKIDSIIVKLEEASKSTMYWDDRIAGVGKTLADDLKNSEKNFDDTMGVIDRRFEKTATSTRKTSGSIVDSILKDWKRIGVGIQEFAKMGIELPGLPGEDKATEPVLAKSVLKGNVLDMDRDVNQLMEASNVAEKLAGKMNKVQESGEDMRTLAGDIGSAFSDARAFVNTDIKASGSTLENWSDQVEGTISSIIGVDAVAKFDDFDSVGKKIMGETASNMIAQKMVRFDTTTYPTQRSAETILDTLENTISDNKKLLETSFTKTYLKVT